MTVALTPGERHEATVFGPLLQRGTVRRPGRGRPRVRPDRVVGDKGDTGRQHRAACRRRGIRITIPRLRTEPRTGPFDRATYRRRERVERLINRCTHSRGLATRYDQLGESFRAGWVIVSTILWLHRA